MTPSANEIPKRKIQNEKLRHLAISVIAGGGAGIVEVMTMYPLDLIKTQSVSIHILH